MTWLRWTVIGLWRNFAFVNHPLTYIVALCGLNVVSGLAAEVYFNDFNGPIGSKYPGWTSSPITFVSATNPPGTGTLPPPPEVTNCDSTNRAQRFLGEFGGPRIGTPSDPGYNRTRVEQTISLTLTNLPPHSALKVSFDLYVLKSWDGNSPRYGPDRWSLSAAGAKLLDTTFSNNHKVATEGSDQNHPRPQSPPRNGTSVTNSLGYKFFGDSIYPLEFTFAHSGRELTLNFNSSLFEGKGTADESWGLDNIRVITASGP